jgi:hypothetical protein
MIKNRPTLFDREVDYLIREVIDSPTVDRSTAIGEIGMLLDEYEADVFDEILKVYLPKNAEKFSTTDIYEGPDKIVRYLDLLEAEMDMVDSFGTSVYNQIAHQRALLRELSARILDKLDAITIYEGGGSGSFLLDLTPEKFSNSIEDSGFERLTISNGTGAVLPILTSKQLKVEEYSFTSDSNGEPGDPRNLDKTFNRDSTAVIFDDNPTTYFEYSRMGNEDIFLGMQFSFANKQIFNCLQVDLVQYSFAQAAEVVKLQYQLSNGQWANMIDTPMALEKGPLYLNPVNTKAVRLVLKSSGSEPIKVGNNRFSNRSILGIQDIKFFSVLFKEKGQALSLEFERLEGNKVSLRNISFLPTQQDLFKYEVFVRNEEGDWQDITLLDTDDNDFVNVANNTLQAKINISIIPEVFKSRDSALKPVTFINEYRRFESQLQNPNLFVVSDIFDPNSLGVVQEDDWNLGLRNNRLARLGGVTLFDGASFELPRLLQAELERLEIYANGKLIPQVDDLTSVSTLSCSLGRTEEGNSVITFSSGDYALDPNATVAFRVRPEALNFKLKGDSYVALTKRPVTPARGNVRVEYLSSDTKSRVEYLQSGETSYKLANEMIYGDFVLQEEVDGLLVASSKAEVTATPALPRSGFDGSGNQYYLDRSNGVLYFSESLSQRLLVSYRYKEIKESDQYEIRTDSNNEPRGIVIPSYRARLFQTEEEVGAVRFAEHDFQTDSFPRYFSDQIANKDNTILYLSHGHLVEDTVLFSENAFPGKVSEEVPYIDGQSELSVGDFVFLPITKSVAGSDMTWSFVIPSDLNVDSSLGYFPKPSSVFVTQRDSEPGAPLPGDWWVNEGAETTINVYVSAGTGLSADDKAEIGMFLTTKRDDRIYYSVDYERGRIFCGEEPLDGSKVKYSLMPYRISYIPCKSKDFNLSGDTVEVDASLLTSNDVYIFFKVAQIKQNIEELKQYYSPVLNSIEFVSN